VCRTDGRHSCTGRIGCLLACAVGNIGDKAKWRQWTNSISNGRSITFGQLVGEALAKDTVITKTV